MLIIIHHHYHRLQYQYFFFSRVSLLMQPDEVIQMEVMFCGTNKMKDHGGNVANIIMIVFALCLGKAKTDGKL